MRNRRTDKKSSYNDDGFTTYDRPILSDTQENHAASVPIMVDTAPESTATEESKKLQVFHEYKASIDDELSLDVGDEILVLREFDDGWALGVNLKTKAQGAFPLVCCQQQITHLDPMSNAQISKRVSSQLVSSADKEAVKAMVNALKMENNQFITPMTYPHDQSVMSPSSVASSQQFHFPSPPQAPPQINHKPSKQTISRFLADLDTYDSTLDENLPEVSPPATPQNP